MTAHEPKVAARNVMTGDRAILEENYESMTRYMQWLSAQEETVEGISYTHIGAGTATGDWLAYAPIESRYVSMAYYAYVARGICSASRQPPRESPYPCLSAAHHMGQSQDADSPW